MTAIGATPWGSRAAARWGHYAPNLLCASIFAVILVGLRPPSGALMFTVPLALMAFVVASWLFMRQHDRRLCELCMLSMPLNAAEQAAKYQRRFWFAHSGAQPRYLIPYLALLVGSNFFPGTIGRIVWALVQSTMIYLIASHSAHRRFQPWCPWCSDGGGGTHHEDAPPPRPVDSWQPA